MKKPTITIEKSKIRKGESVSLRPLPSKGKMRPRFGTLFEPDFENPLVEFEDETINPGEAEMLANREVSVALQTVLDERKERRDQFRVATDSTYYVVLCFQCEEQKLEFLTAMDWLRWGDRLLNGLDCAQSLGVSIKPINLPMRTNKRNVPVLLRQQEVIK